jgi:hypothetical protein
MHQVTLTAVQLQMIAGGQSIPVTTSIVESHTHDFTLKEGAVAITPVPAPTGTSAGPY